VPENVQPFVSGGYERNEEVWKVFSAAELLGDERFLDVAQW
jgi:twitching motility protein PilI